MKELPQDSWSLSLEQIFSSRFANQLRQRARARRELGNPARRRFELEPLESRLLLSADLIGDVPQEPAETPALQDTPFSFDAPANAAADHYTLRFNAGSADLELLEGTTVVASQSLASISEIIINGEDGWDDSLTLDFGFGGFFSVSGGITYGGGSDGIDGLSVVGGAFTTLTHTATTTGPGRSGEIVYEDGINPALAIHYAGLEPLDLSGSATTDLVFNLPGTDDQAILEDDGIEGNAIFQVRSQNPVAPTFETTKFSVPSASLTVNMGTDSGSLTVASLPDFTRALRINGQAGSDTVTFTGSTTFSTLAVSVGGSVTDASGTSLAVTGNASLSGSSITLGDNAEDTIDFGSLTFRSSGDVKISEDSDTVLAGTSIASTASIASAGAIVDGNAQGFDVVAASLALRAMGGIGSGDALETFVDVLAASNGGESGNIQILNGRALSIGSFDGVSGVSQSASGSIEVTASSPLTVDAAVTNGNAGNTTLTAGAGHSNDDRDDLTINANVIASGGSITLNGNDLVVNESIVSAIGIGSIVVNFGGAEGFASVTLNGGANLSVVAGLIRVMANDAISVNNGATLASTGSGDIVLIARPGVITIGGTLDAGMNDVTLTASGGVVFTDSSVLQVDVGSTFAGEFTSIAISDQVTLGGTLNVELAPWYKPAPDDRIHFMTFGSRTEEFFDTTLLPANFAIDQSDPMGLDLVYREDNIPPAVTVDQADVQPDPTNASPILFTVVFSEEITNFTAEDISFAGSTVGGMLTAALSGGDGVYTVSVTGMDGVGTVVASIDAGAVTDLAGNLSLASTSTDNTVSFDNIAPTVTIDQAAEQADPTNASTIVFSVVFSEAITSFTAEDISFAGSTVGGTFIVEVGGSGAAYTVSVTGMDGTGTVVASVVADAATDVAGNLSLASTSTDNTVTFDNVAPSVTIDQAAEQADPTNASPILFAVVFSEVITGFTAEDISFAGTTVGGTLTAVVSGGGASYTVSVSGMDGVGTVVASIDTGAATDSAGNSSLASTSTDNTVSFDNVAPTVTIDQAAGQADPTNASPILFTVVFSEVITGFTAEDVSFAGSTVGGTLTAVVSGGGATYTVSITGMDGSGMVVASVVANAATDLAGNLSFASTSTDNTVVVSGGTGPDLVGSVQWHPDDLLIPGDCERATIVVKNVGNAATHDRVKVSLYASADGVLDASDILLDTDETCGSLQAGASTTVYAHFDLSSALLPGEYVLLAVVDPTNKVAESNEANNVALGAEFDFRWMFGNVPGHGRETLTVRDADGTKVSFSLSGYGTGEITVENGEWDLELTGTNGGSVLAILTLGGGDGRVAIDDIHVKGPLWGVIAPTMDLTGTLAVEGALTAGLLIGSATDAVISASTILGTRFFGFSVKGIAILGDLENSEILIGADEDAYSAGNLGDLLITGSMISSDVSVDGSIRSITILDEMSDDSSFVASDFPRFAFIDGELVDPDTDPRFVTELDDGCTINWNGCGSANLGWVWPYMVTRTCGMNFADFLRYR